MYFVDISSDICYTNIFAFFTPNVWLFTSVGLSQNILFLAQKYYDSQSKKCGGKKLHYIAPHQFVFYNVLHQI